MVKPTLKSKALSVVVAGTLAFGLCPAAAFAAPAATAQDATLVALADDMKITWKDGSCTVGVNQMVDLHKLIDVTGQPEGTTLAFGAATTSDLDIVDVLRDGRVTGLKEGTASIKVNAMKDGVGVGNEVEITVKVSTMKIEGPKSVAVDGKAGLKANYKPDGYAVTWTSSNPSIAKVDADGNVTGVTPGDVTITATATKGSEKVEVEHKMTVDAAKMEVAWTDVPMEIGIGQTEDLSKKVTIKGQPDNTVIRFFTADTASVDLIDLARGGEVKGLKEGTAKIDVYAYNTTTGTAATDKVTLELQVHAAHLEGPATIDKGATGALAFKCLPDGYTVTWKSGSETIATVDADGKVKGLKEGKVTITATASKKDASDIVKTWELTVASATSLKGATVTVPAKTYTGKKVEPQGIVVKLNGKTLERGVDYTVSLSNNTKVGYGKATIKGMGKYKDSVTKSFKIKPAVVSYTLKAGKKSLVVKVKGAKVTKANMDGFQIQAKAGSATTTVTTKSMTKKTVSSLKGAKKYTVKIRTYKTVDGKKWYSAWSSAKKVTTKK